MQERETGILTVAIELERFMGGINSNGDGTDMSNHLGQLVLVMPVLDVNHAGVCGSLVSRLIMTRGL